MVAWKAASSIIVAKESSCFAAVRAPTHLVSSTTGRVLVMRRGPTAKFMANAVVFPGGVATTADEKLGPPTKIAALRELFEETGLLIGQNESASTSKKLLDLQVKTRDDPELFKLACPDPPVDDLIEWNTWLTPSSYKQRFMTSFFFVRMNGEPDISMCEKEMSNYSWSDPRECLLKGSTGEVILPPPQVYELSRVAQTPLEELHLFGNTTHIFCPQIITWPDGKRITNVLPGDHLYIEDDCFNQPPRNLTEEEVRVDFHKATHRQEFKSKPLYALCRLYMHNLPEKYKTTLHQFEADPSKL